MRKIGQALAIGAGLVMASQASAGLFIGADGELAAAVGTTGQGGLGTSGGIQLGYAPFLVGVGPFGFSAFPEIEVSSASLRRTDGDRSVLRGTLGGQLVFTWIYIRRPGSFKPGRGLRLDTAIRLHGGFGSVNNQSGLKPTADVGFAINLGLGPVSIGPHVDVGVMANNGSQEGFAWVSPGAQIGIFF